MEGSSQALGPGSPFLNALSKTQGWRRLCLEVLTALCRDKDPNLTEEQAREQARKVRRAIHALDEVFDRQQAAFESHCVLMPCPGEASEPNRIR